MIKISILGDIMCEPLLIRAAKKGKTYNFNPIFNEIKEIIKDSDYAIGNLETPLAGKDKFFCNELYSFNAPDEFAIAVKNAGIDMVTTANNHCLDRGMDGLDRTLEILDNAGIGHCGTSSEKKDSRIGYFKIGNIRFALVCGTYGTNHQSNHVLIMKDREKNVNLLRGQDAIGFYKIGKKDPTAKTRNNRWIRFLYRVLRKAGLVPWKAQMIYKLFRQKKTIPYSDDYMEGEIPSIYTDMLLKDLQEARKNADFVFFFPHIGGQFNTEPGTFSKYITKCAADSGCCDIIVSSHAHVIQGHGILSETPCFYSIGNVSMSPNSYYIPDDADTDLGIILHIYLEGSRIHKISFTMIHISEKIHGMMKILPIDKINVSGSLIARIRKNYRLFTGMEMPINKPFKREYDIKL